MRRSPLDPGGQMPSPALDEEHGMSSPTQINRAAVQGLALFEQLQPEQIDEVLRLATGRRYAAGDHVFEQGQTAEHFFVLLHGRLRVTQVTSEGQQVVVRMVNP